MQIGVIMKEKMKEYCNPVNIEYKFQHYGKAAHREAADPTLVWFQGRYYMFASMSAGFYYSVDLMDWQWHENRELGLYMYAPDVRQQGEYLYFSASDRKPVSIWRTKDPLSDVFEKVSTPFAFWDPNLFFDDDGKVYLFWGCGNKEPLYGIELDSGSLMPAGEKVPLIYPNQAEHGFERIDYPGKEKENNTGLIMKGVNYLMNPKGTPYMEGMFCNKWNGIYYLQYAAPGTEFPVYSDGVYVAGEPLGPYKYQSHNPFSFKPSGFINGAGHGSTIEDEYGNLWHASTMRISVNGNFERRVGVFPAGLDEDGILYCNQHFADYSCVVPAGRFEASSLLPRYMLLSYNKKATASSIKEGHGVELALNEDIRTWWCARGSAGEWFQADLGKEYSVHSVQLNLAEESILVSRQKDGSYRYIDSGNHLRSCYIMEGSVDGSNWFIIKDAASAERDLSHDYVVLKQDTRMRYIKVTAMELAYGQNFAISGLRVFGLDNGRRPGVVSRGAVTRPDDLTAKICWENAEGSIGYNVRYGIGEKKLYTSYLVYNTNEVLITALNKGTRYWYCIDSFNESGITQGQVVPLEMG